MSEDEKNCPDCFGEMDEHCNTCNGTKVIPLRDVPNTDEDFEEEADEDLEEEAFDRMLNAADAKYERDHDK